MSGDDLLLTHVNRWIDQIMDLSDVPDGPSDDLVGQLAVRRGQLQVLSAVSEVIEHLNVCTHPLTCGWSTSFAEQTVALDSVPWS